MTTQATQTCVTNRAGVKGSLFNYLHTLFIIIIIIIIVIIIITTEKLFT